MFEVAGLKCPASVVRRVYIDKRHFAADLLTVQQSREHVDVVAMIEPFDVAAFVLFGLAELDIHLRDKRQLLSFPIDGYYSYCHVPLLFSEPFGCKTFVEHAKGKHHHLGWVDFL